MASYPTFDLSRITDESYYKEVLEADYDPLYNRTTMGAYEPGSTFKPCTAIAGLSENLINTETTILCDGVFTKYETQGYAPECWIYSQNNFTHGYDNVTKAIMDSCNIFFYTLADDMGIRTLMEYAKNFGLGEATGIELPEVTGQHGQSRHAPELRRGPVVRRRHGCRPVSASRTAFSRHCSWRSTVRP